MSSSRLPGKIMMTVLNQPILLYQIERLKLVKNIDEIIIATTINNSDDVVFNFFSNHNIKVYRGSENDVMERVIKAGESVSTDIIVEITGDCPLIDPEIVSTVINQFLSNNVDYVSNNNIRSYPDGMDVQVYNLDTLKKSFEMTKNKLDREHVTLHIRNNPQIFSRINMEAPKKIRFPNLGLTLDEKEDFNMIRNIIEFFGKDNLSYTCYDIISYLNNNPNIAKINSNVIRKGDT